ncbi:hypothetical protein CR513_29635, partial [Mucuna pruriens]
MVEDKVIILGPNKLPNLHIRTRLKGRKKLNHIEGSDPPKDDPKYEIISLRHSVKKAFTVCYDIKSKIFNSRQRILSLDQYQGLKMCKADSIAYIELVERGRIFEFLHGLNSEYNPIRIQILGKEKLLSLFEENVSQKDQPPKENPSQRVVVENIARSDKENLLGSCGMTMKGKSFFNISNSVLQSIWIHDSKVIDHMILFPSYYTSYLKISKKQLIIVANGDHVPIVGSGNVQLQSSLSLHNILHVPRLANNLISIHMLIQDWNCLITIFFSHCVIQKLTMGRTI